MLPRTSLIRVQRDLYQKMKVNARNQFGGLSPRLQSYFEVYQQDMQDFECYSSQEELSENIQESHICLVGDYHTLSQAQRMLLRLMRKALPACRREKRPICLMLEMLAEEDTAAAKRFLEGKITEKRFLSLIKFHRHWGFFWPHYRPIFQFAREHGIEVIGINANQRGIPLEKRDAEAARIIAEHSVKAPKTLTFIHIGDLHLAEPHLPRQLRKQFRDRNVKRTIVTVHQNAERFYWKLVDSGTESLIDTVRVRDHVYCVLNSPPWLKLQSHVQWHELGLKESTTLGQNVTELAQLDFSDEVLEYLHTIRDFIGINGSFVASRFEDFDLQGPIDLDFVQGLAKDKTFDSREIKTLLASLVTFDSVFIPKANTLFTSKIHANQYAYLAAIYLHAKLSGFNEIFLEPRKDFYRFVFVEAIGFLGSKIINPKRKCKNKSELSALAKESEGKDTRLAATVALDALHGKRIHWNVRDSVHQAVVYYQAARWLGALIGEWHYENLIRGKISRNNIRDLFLTKPSTALAKRWVYKWTQSDSPSDEKR